MAEERKEMTYEEELKALKEKWAERRKAEKESNRVALQAEKKEKAKANVEKALQAINEIDPVFRGELSCVVKRLNMFLNGERYTRKVKEK